MQKSTPKNGLFWSKCENSDMFGLSIGMESNRGAETEIFMDKIFHTGACICVCCCPTVPIAAGKESQPRLGQKGALQGMAWAALMEPPGRKAVEPTCK